MSGCTDAVPALGVESQLLLLRRRDYRQGLGRLFQEKIR